MGKRELTRRHIIEKTAPIFNRKGYAATSLQDLTEATGLTKGSIYGNFKDKDEVALRAFAHNLRLRKRGFTRGIREAGDSVVEQLAAYPRHFRESYADIFRVGGCPILNTSIDAADTHPSLHAAVRRAIEDWRVGLETLIRRGMESGELRAGIDVGSTTALLISLMEGGVWMARATGRSGDLLAAVNHAEELIRGLAANRT